MRFACLALCAVACLAATAAHAQSSGTFAVRQMTPETAQKAVNAALADCRKRGFQVTVAVVDRAGNAQALLRDRLAGPHTVQTAIDKGFTAVSFRTDTLEFARLTGPQSLAAGVRQIPRVVAVGGGVQISAGGQLLGAVGVSGAPTGEADELCAKAGIEAIREDTEL
ncbi:MAG: GlcG/HbpS family heme-binding protein [Betaproteobacteria bacterium]|jgi:uncharacterized protein GlcG (DUF336 family)